MVNYSPRKKTTFSLSSSAVIIAALLLGLSYGSVEVYKHLNPSAPFEGSWQVCFTPNQACQKLIVQQINDAKESILIQAYSFTDKDIIEALIKAKHRGIQVSVLLDYSNLKAKYSGLNEILTHQITVRIDKLPGIAHNKIIIIDNHILIGGSYNFSKGAYKRNAENVMIIHDKPLASEYINNWQKRWELSTAPGDIKNNKLSK